MTRAYKPREYFTILCSECAEIVLTNSYRTLRCKACAKSAEYKANMLDYKWRLKKLCHAAKFRAMEKELPFYLTVDYLIELWDNNQGKCVISKRNLDLESYGTFKQVNPNAPSIDRIIPSLGYVQGNVRIVTYHVNVALSEFGLEALKDLIKDING